MDEAPIAAARRRRRAAERQRRIRARRRNFLLAIAVAAFVVGTGMGSAVGNRKGSGVAAPGPGGASLDPGTDVAPVPTVTGFHDPVPVLMYHAISSAPVGAAMPGLFVPEGEFEDQMQWLSDQGYHGVTLDQLFAAWNDGQSIATNPVVITFDDGLQSQYVGARPMLERLGWPGVLNVAISHLDSGDITPAEVRDLISEGWEIDSHSFSHVDVTTLDAAGLKHEIADSRSFLQEKFHVPVDFFCYPAGVYDDDAIASVQAAGYLGATTTNEGLASPDEDPDALSRIRVEPGDGTDGLAAKLAAQSL